MISEPRAEARRPFARAIEGVTLLARRDGFAVHEAGHGRQDVMTRRGDHGLVEHRKSFRQAPLPDRRASRECTPEGAEVAVVVTVANFDGLHRGRTRSCMIAGRRESECQRQPQIPALDTVRNALDEALRPRQPAAPSSGLAN
jgi:hypothetical protein